MRFFGSGKPRILLANVRFCRNQLSECYFSQKQLPCANSKYRAGGRLTGHVTCLPAARVFKNWTIGAVLVRLFRNLKRIGSSSLGILRNFHENRNAQGQAVCDFPGPADRVYCSQTVFFVKTVFLRRRAPRNRYPALIVNIGQVGLTGHATCLLTARVLKN